KPSPPCHRGQCQLREGEDRTRVRFGGKEGIGIAPRQVQQERWPAESREVRNERGRVLFSSPFAAGGGITPGSPGRALLPECLSVSPNARRAQLARLRCNR